MRIHLVHAHPEPASFVAAMRDVMRSAFQEAGHQVTVADLHAMGFNPIMSGEDFKQRQRADYLVYAREQRHAAESSGFADDIAEEIDRVLQADLLAFSFPVLWFSVPAMLKGWIERVFVSGIFYGGRQIYARGGLAGKKAFAAMSLGGRRHMFGPEAVHGDLETGMLRHFFQGTLGYVGLRVHRPFVAYHVPYVDDAARRGMLDDLRNCVLSLDQRAIMPMPDLDRYDETFRRRPAMPTPKRVDRPLR